MITALTQQVVSRNNTSNPNVWIRDGWRMAHSECDSVFGSIDKKHGAEVEAFRTIAHELKARGHVALQRRNELEHSLQSAGYDAAHHLRELAQGRVDRVWAVGLSIVSAALIMFVLLAFGPTPMALLLSLMVFASIAAVEEFFVAYEEKATLREGIFLTFAVLALIAQFWLGTLRGMFLAAITPEGVGPVTEMLHQAGPILQWCLGILALVTECLCGYKWFRVRVELNSAAARAVRQRDRLNEELIALHAGVERAEREPSLRRAYRDIGARQYLAAAARATKEAGHDHFRRAAIGAAIALVILTVLSVFFLPSTAAAEEPMGRLIILLDRTKSVTTDSFEQNVVAIGPILNAAPVGYRVVIVGVTDSFGRPEILLDHQLPAKAGYLGLGVQAGRERLVFQWREIAKGLTPIYEQSDVLGSLALLGYLGGSAPDTVLVVFSDLRQSSKELDIEQVKAVRVDPAIEHLKKIKAIPVLAHTRVFLLGVDPTGKSAAYFNSLKALWLRFFAEAGGTVEAFAITRQMPPLNGPTPGRALNQEQKRERR